LRKIILLLAAALALAGCSASISTTPDEVGLRYSGSSTTLAAEKFVKCNSPSEAEYGSAGDKTYLYPSGQRSWKFSDDPGSDSPPMTITAKGGITMKVSGTVTFTPRFTSVVDGQPVVNCDLLRKFHETIGRKYGAWLKGADDTTTIQVEGAEGWQNMLSTYIKDPTDKAADQGALSYTWDQLATDPTIKTQWEQGVKDALPGLIKQQSGDDYFAVDNVFFQAPQIPDEIAGGLKAKEAAVLAGQAASAASTAAAGCDTVCQNYQLNQAIVKAINDGKVQVWPVPAGASVNLPSPR
jgi:hypothetical protein